MMSYPGTKPLIAALALAATTAVHAAGVAPDAFVMKLSNEVIDALGTRIEWVHSYLTQNKFYCIYIAPNKEMVLEHARQGGFPAESVAEVRTVIDPTTAE